MLAAIAAILLLAAIDASPIEAYTLAGKKWPTRTITYHAAAPQYAAAITDAVAAWNATGANVRFKPASSRRAQLRIVQGTTNGATIGYLPRTAVTQRTLDGSSYFGDARCGTRVKVPGKHTRARVSCKFRARVVLHTFPQSVLAQPEIQRFMRVVATEQLGRVLGLGQELKRCAAMNSLLASRCAGPPHPWQARCRLVEADDVHGLIRRYGGQARELAPEFCDTVAAPGA